jgi:hypothetical protein
MKFLATYIMQGRWQAITVASSLALLSLVIPPISIFSSATVALVTLRRGAGDGLSVLVCAAIAAGCLGYLLIGSYWFALLYVTVLCLPIWLVSIILREGRHLALALEISTLLGVAGVLGFYLYMDNPADSWQQALSQMIPHSVALANDPQKIAKIAHYMTGAVAAGSVISLLFSLFVARWWQAQLYNPGGFKREFLSLNTPPRLALGSIAIIALAALGAGIVSEIAWNVVILVMALYVFVGAAIMHNLLARLTSGRYWVPLFYVMLFLVPHYVMGPVALIGLTDPWLNLRSKINSNPV